MSTFLNHDTSSTDCASGLNTLHTLQELDASYNIEVSFSLLSLSVKTLLILGCFQNITDISAVISEWDDDDVDVGAYLLFPKRISGVFFP
jgi:hypothetical protein